MGSTTRRRRRILQDPRAAREMTERRPCGALRGPPAGRSQAMGVCRGRRGGVKTNCPTRPDRHLWPHGRSGTPAHPPHRALVGVDVIRPASGFMSTDEAVASPDRVVLCIARRVCVAVDEERRRSDTLLPFGSFREVDLLEPAGEGAEVPAVYPPRAASPALQVRAGTGGSQRRAGSFDGRPELAQRTGSQRSRAAR